MNNNNGEWIAVRKTKRNRRRTFLATTKCSPILTSFENMDKPIEHFVPYEKITNSVVEAESKFSSKFRKFFIKTLNKIMNGKKPIIRVFGIGSFTASRDSLYQLALLECLIKHFYVPFVTSQEPLSSKCEINYLESRGIRVLPVDDLRSNPPLFNSSDVFTILYMIHCTGEMYENVLSAYQQNDALQRLILIGNDPHGIDMQMMSIISDRKTPHFARFAQICTAIPLPKFEMNENAFQGTAICFVNEEEDIDE